MKLKVIVGGLLAAAVMLGGGYDRVRTYAERWWNGTAHRNGWPDSCVRLNSLLRCRLTMWDCPV